MRVGVSTTDDEKVTGDELLDELDSFESFFFKIETIWFCGYIEWLENVDSTELLRWSFTGDIIVDGIDMLSLSPANISFGVSFETFGVIEDVGAVDVNDENVDDVPESLIVVGVVDVIDCWNCCGVKSRIGVRLSIFLSHSRINLLNFSSNSLFDVIGFGAFEIKSIDFISLFNFCKTSTTVSDCFVVGTSFGVMVTTGATGRVSLGLCVLLGLVVDCLNEIFSNFGKSILLLFTQVTDDVADVVDDVNGGETDDNFVVVVAERDRFWMLLLFLSFAFITTADAARSSTGNNGRDIPISRRLRRLAAASVNNVF